MDTQSNIKVKVDLKQALKDFELLDKRVDETVDSVQQLENEVLDLEKKQKALGPKQVNRYKQYTAAIDKAKNKLKEEKQDLKQLNNERKKVKKVLDEGAKGQKDYSGATSMADRATGGLVAQFQMMKVATLGVTKGLGKVKVALIATGIGAFVVIMGALYKAFTSSEKGQNKFSKLMGYLGVIVNNTMDMVADFGEKLIWVFTSPKEALNSFVELIKSQIINRFNAAIETVGFLGSAIKKVFQGDFGGAMDDAKKAGSSYIDTLTGVENTLEKVANGVKGVVEEVTEEMKMAGIIADKRAKADKVDRKLLIERAEANRKYNELRERAADKEHVSIADRITALKEAGAVNDTIAAKEIEAARLRFEAKRDENAMSKSTKEDLDEQAQLQANLIDLEARRLKRQKTLTAEITTNLREEATERKAIANEFEKNFQFHPIYGFISNEAIAAGKKDLEGILKIQAEYAKKQADDLALTDVEKLELEQERKLKELDDLNASEEQKAGIKAYYGKKIADAQKDADDKQKKLDKLVFQAKLNMTKSALMNMANALGKSSKAGKAAAAAAALINTFQGITAELQTKTVTPWEFAIKLVNVASTAAIGFKAVKNILATNPKGTTSTGSTPSGGRGASGMTPSSPSFNVVGAGAQSQLASAIAEQEQPPVQAYVVSQDVTTAQSLERNIVSGATIGG